MGKLWISGISFPIAIFDKFGDKTDIDLPAEMIGNVILIVRQYPAEIRTTPIFGMFDYCIDIICLSPSVYMIISQYSPYYSLNMGVLFLKIVYLR